MADKGKHSVASGPHCSESKVTDPAQYQELLKNASVLTIEPPYAGLTVNNGSGILRKRFTEIKKTWRNFMTDPGSSFMYEEIEYTDRKTGKPVKLRVYVQTGTPSDVSEISDLLRERLDSE